MFVRPNAALLSSLPAAEPLDCVWLDEDASLVVDFRAAVFAKVSRAVAAIALPSDLCDYAMGQELDEAVGIRGSPVKNALVVVALLQAQRYLERDMNRQRVL